MADFHVFADGEDLSRAAAELFIARSHSALNDRTRFTVALSGGSTPSRLLKTLASEPYWRAVPWDRTLVFWADERAVPPDDDRSNYKLAHDALLAHVPIPTANIFRIRGELGAERATEDMRRNLVNAFGDKDAPCFDLLIQGMGTDGHTASLFPDNASPDEMDWVIPVISPPSVPEVDRVSLTIPVLNNARSALFLVSGRDRQSLVQEIMNDPTAPDRYTAARLEAGETLWYLDEAAFGVNL